MQHQLQFFEHDHLPPNLQEVSRPFGELAGWMMTRLPENPQRTIAIQKLMEAKDAAVRAAIFRGDPGFRPPHREADHEHRHA